jgi:tetratricopeptide (TPR) repeat protein
VQVATSLLVATAEHLGIVRPFAVKRAVPLCPALKVIVALSERLRQYPKALDYRLKIESLDPWNGKNYLQMARLYRTVGDLEKAKASLEKLFAFAAATPEGETATKEFADLLGS